MGQILDARKIPKDSEDRTSVLYLGGIASAIGIILMVWPATGVVAISWVIAIAAFLVAAILFYLAHRTKRLNNRLDAARVRRAA